jgi:ferredoxin
MLAQGVAMVTAGTTMLGWLWSTARARLPSPWRIPVRPPTAGDDDAAFRAACIRCGLCGTECENGCIRYFGLDETKWGALTPYLDVRERSCTLCMRCTQVCPTGALQPVEDEPEAIKRTVRMGLAVVDADRCISYLGRICGYCHDACPLPGHAIRLVPKAKPVVLADGCVGCGRCVELCPQYPTAIDVWRAPDLKGFVRLEPREDP